MSGREEKISHMRLSVVQYAALAIFLILSYGLWSLQIRKSDEYESMAQQNRVHKVPILAPRGKILDREGRLIVDNYPSFSVYLLRDQLRDTPSDARKVAVALHITPEEVLDKVRRAQLARDPVYQPLVIKDDITPDENAFIEAHKDEFPELETVKVYRRLYPRNGFMAHLIGYVGEVSEDMLSSGKYDVYSRGAIVGQSGVEQQYNEILMGRDGSRHVVVDSKGREVPLPKNAGKQVTEAATVGSPLTLTIDLDLQIAAEQALEGKSGAVVALDPRTGEILAMASRPTFDPNDFAVRISRDEWNQLINGINCPGGGTFYGHFHKCHKVHGAGVDIDRAITQSCDTFFYNLGERLGIGRIAKYATALGLGKKTGVDLPNEASGIMPSEEWKIRNYREKWFAGETISVAIGQGAVTTTPLQLARTIGGVTMDGILYRPHVVDLSKLPEPLRKSIPPNTGETRVAIDAKNWVRITDGMSKVLLPGGTASSAHIVGVDMAGKTGSAQVVSNALRKASKVKLGSDFNDNGWFVGVAPRRNPEIVVAVLFQGGEHGTFAARLASQVIKAYVDKQRRLRNNPMLFSDKIDPGSVPVAALWHAPEEGELSQLDPLNPPNDDGEFQAGQYLVKVPVGGKSSAKSAALRSGRALATVLPGAH